MKNIITQFPVYVIALLLTFNSCTENENVFVAKDFPALVIKGDNPLSFGTDSKSLTFEITNEGSGSFDWEASGDKPWLSISPGRGAVSSSSEKVTVTVNRTGLPYGTYSGQITVTSDWGNATIDVNLEKTATHTVTFAAGSHGSITENKEQKIAHGGDCEEVRAVPDNSYTFDGWSGGYTGSVNPLTVKNVTSDMTITANFVTKGKWLSHDDGSFENGISIINTSGYLCVRFTKPSGWSSARVTKVKIYIRPLGAYENFRIKGWDDYKYSNSEYWPTGVSTTLKDNISQSSGWKEHDVSHSFTSSQFFVGIYNTSSSKPYLGADEGSFCAQRSYLKISSSEWLLITAGMDFGIRVYVEPSGEKAPQTTSLRQAHDQEKEAAKKGMWIEPDIDDFSYDSDNRTTIKTKTQ